MLERSLEDHSESKDALHSEHLKEGVSPIVACVGTPEHFQEEIDSEKGKIETSVLNGGESLNLVFGEDPENLTKMDIKNAGRKSYLISPVNNLSKFSKSFVNCTGLVVAGRDKRTGEDISLMSHQSPDYFLSSKENEKTFSNDLGQRLKELKERCEDGTIDAVVVGGNLSKKENYSNSIKLLSKEVTEVLGFEPVIMTGPKAAPKITENIDFKENIFYDNRHRRLYIIRPKVSEESTQSFVRSRIEEQQEKW